MSTLQRSSRWQIPNTNSQPSFFPPPSACSHSAHLDHTPTRSSRTSAIIPGPAPSSFSHCEQSTGLMDPLHFQQNYSIGTSWMSEPIFIDPTWPRQNNARETVHQVPSARGNSLTPIAEEPGSSSMMRGFETSHGGVSAVHGLSRGLQLPSAPPTRPPVFLPFAKACHNFLLARRVRASKRRRLLQEHQKGSLIPPADLCPPSPTPTHTRLPPSDMIATGSSIRSIASIAQVDETRAPRARKRQRQEVPEASHLLPPAEIVEPFRYSRYRIESAELLESTVHGQRSRFEEREARRAAWTKEAQRKAANVSLTSGIARRKVRPEKKGRGSS